MPRAPWELEGDGVAEVTGDPCFASRPSRYLRPAVVGARLQPPHCRLRERGSDLLKGPCLVLVIE